jgi:hypothetical protein
MVPRTVRMSGLQATTHSPACESGGRNSACVRLALHVALISKPRTFEVQAVSPDNDPQPFPAWIRYIIWAGVLTSGWILAYFLWRLL